MMKKRIEGGGWFETDKARKFVEDSWWDGSNHISRATGSQWEHQQLYYTASGNWVLCFWSQWQGVKTTYTRIDESSAINWLMDQSEGDCGSWEDFEYLPKSFQDAVADRQAASEV
jgi:hypothetical protein